MTATTHPNTTANTTANTTDAARSAGNGNVREGLVDIDGQEWYLITDVARMAPFLVSVVSDGDRWAFASSAGPLTAGRESAQSALFPYETDDRLHESVGSAGPVTALRVDGALWRPFRERDPIGRRLAKSVYGDRLLTEERHATTGLLLRTQWASCDRFGFVRTATLANHGAQPRRVELLDGLVGVMPHGLDPATYQRMSNLTNAYKRSELIDPTFAVYSLESPVSDRPEPSEVLRATTVWSTGLDGATVLLDRCALLSFEDDRMPAGAPQRLMTGRPGAYLLRHDVVLEPGASISWHIVADVAREQHQIVELLTLARSDADIPALIAHELDDASRQLAVTMAKADAMQRTADRVATAHHVANVTYNVMRGGVPLTGYTIEVPDLATFLRARDRRVAARHADWLDRLPSELGRRELLERATSLGDVHLTRLLREYVPFSFSRRHGDPSRPWNTFSIRVRDDAGNPVIHYEGNWRDVFQNWEALCHSFPEYLPSVVTLFVDASTADGHNPYRITRDGIDWEVPDPEDPWSNIGYWGDHQVIYLLRLLDATERFLPGTLEALLAERSFTFADVPYRIAPYDELLADPKSTITFDAELDAAVEARVAEIGADGKLLVGADGQPVLATLMEKLSIVALAKLANFVPGGGIWMNTQRPEWNDANNALVGHGLSMVTLCHLRQYLARLVELVRVGAGTYTMSGEVAGWLAATIDALDSAPVDAAGDVRARRALMDRLGAAGSDYRWTIYRSGFSGRTVDVDADDLVALCTVAIEHLDATIRGARRPDGLYAGYQLLSVTDDGAEVDELEEMLEGQVAVLGCGVLDAEERLAVVEALFESALYRPDQHSFLLAPVKALPSFLDKGVIPAERLGANALLSALVDAADTSVVRVAADGCARFDAGLVDEPALHTALDRLAHSGRWGELVGEHRAATAALYEEVFRHHSFLGRSGSMHAYEGIGSIYWHMVTKLLLAVQEAAIAAVDEGAPTDTVAALVSAYHRVRDGLGAQKSASEFGAVPTDPYSHTPAHAGAQQPGMTGAVKEELLARPLELGVRVRSGRIEFDPRFMRSAELLDRAVAWEVLDAAGELRRVELPSSSVGLTCCQVPVVVQIAAGEPVVEVELRDGGRRRFPGRSLDRDLAAEVFGRTGEVVRIDAIMPPEY